MAVVVTGIGLIVSALFQVFIREDLNVITPRKEWYSWLTDPSFYLVGNSSFACVAKLHLL